MTRGGLAIALLAALPLAGQAVPDSSQAGRTETSWYRAPTVRLDPFGNAFIPHWGFVITATGVAANNAFNFRDLGAVLLLSDSNAFGVAEAIDAMGLLPRGAGARGAGGANVTFHLGGPIGPLTIALSAAGRGYGGFQLDDRAVALFRDGNGALQEFSLGTSRGAALGTAEAGLHLLWRLKPLGSIDGVRLTLGAGARLLRPVFYAEGRSTVANGGRVVVSNDTILADIGIEVLQTPIEESSEVTDAIFSGTRGSGMALDFVLRAEWPTNGLAFEAQVANLGSVTVDRVERSMLDFNVTSTSLDTVFEALDTLDLVAQDTVDGVEVSLPRLVRFAGSAWANSILQLDAAATLPVGGPFGAPLLVELGTTWRFVRTLPLRAGLILGGAQGIGYSAGLGIEGRNFLFRVTAQSLGGFLQHARGVGGHIAFGTFF